MGSGEKWVENREPRPGPPFVPSPLNLPQVCIPLGGARLPGCGLLGGGEFTPRRVRSPDNRPPSHPPPPPLSTSKAGGEGLKPARPASLHPDTQQWCSLPAL